MNTEKINCDITKDLLPLYVDDVLSRESKNAVEEHLQHCPQCRKIAEGLNASLPNVQALPDTENHFFIQMQKKFRKLSLMRILLAILIVIIIWGLANCYLAIHYRPINPKALPEYIDECLDVVSIGDEYYLHQTDFFAQGEIVLLDCENGEINFYLGENGLRSLGLGRSWMITPKYQRLIDPAVMSEINTVNYCKPDGRVIVTLWKAGDKIHTVYSK
ncbi:MAG: zf-HC2 domain-containing protein [Lachnospiraceae bacterium]|nr:zf-HC2 domain-containing protein [Lachnospiraceae bacterium]